MGAPGPTAEQLKTILEIAVRVPDHGKLTPWRLVLFEGKAREKFGEIIEKHDVAWAGWLLKAEGMSPDETGGLLRELIIREYAGWPGQLE